MEQTKLLLEELAKKLGTTVEYLWGVLLKQAKVEAIQWTIILLIFIIYSLLCIKYLLWGLRDWDSFSSSEEEHYFTVWFILGVIWCVFFVIILANVTNLVNAIFNPEYWALKEILSLINK